MMMRRTRLSKNPIASVFVLASVVCLLFMVVSVSKLPELVNRSVASSIRPTVNRNTKASAWDGEGIGEFGKMLVEMLPEDLAFTIFAPSDRAFERDLGLRSNDSLAAEKWKDTYATLTRILGFSVVPRMITSSAVALGKEMSFDSISGFGVCIWKGLDGSLTVNGIRLEAVDFARRGMSVVHVIDGVLMDADFEQSARPYED